MTKDDSKMISNLASSWKILLELEQYDKLKEELEKVIKKGE